jgi:hypothetical protein
MLIGPAEIADGTEIDEADLELVGGFLGPDGTRNDCHGRKRSGCGGGSSGNNNG